MCHIRSMKRTSPRFRSHFFERVYDDIPACGAMGLETDQFTEGEFAPRCAKCEKKAMPVEVAE